MQVARAIALEATLSFLGVGVPVTEPSLGMLIANGFEFLLSGNYWISFFPGIALRHRDRRHQPRRRPPARRAEPAATCDERPTAQRPRPAHAFFTKEGVAKAVDGVDFDVAPRRGPGAGRRIGLGQDGHRLLDPRPDRSAGPDRRGQLDPLRGRGADGRAAGAAARASAARSIAMIFQDPMMTLNPVLRVDTQMIETVQAHERVSARRRRASAPRDALVQVGIASPDERLRAYPHQFSGGMRQRVAIAIALLHKPEADRRRRADHRARRHHPGPDPVRGRSGCAAEIGTAMIWVTHDLAVVAGLADRIAVMYAGRIVETGPHRRRDRAADASLHQGPDRLGAVAEHARPQAGADPRHDAVAAEAAARAAPSRRAARSPIDKCNEMPALEEHRPGHWARCWRAAA